MRCLICPLCVLIVLSSLVLIGCGGPESPVRTLRPQDVTTVVSPLEEAEEELLSSPLEFSVPFSRALVAQQRVDIFFHYYLKGTPSSLAADKNGVITHSAQTENYVFKVSRSPSKKGHFYRVECRLSANAKAKVNYAARNAHNLAHFIREGKFEAALLER